MMRLAIWCSNWQNTQLQRGWGFWCAPESIARTLLQYGQTMNLDRGDWSKYGYWGDMIDSRSITSDSCENLDCCKPNTPTDMQTYFLDVLMEWGSTLVWNSLRLIGNDNWLENILKISLCLQWLTANTPKRYNQPYDQLLSSLSALKEDVGSSLLSRANGGGICISWQTTPTLGNLALGPTCCRQSESNLEWEDFYILWLSRCSWPSGNMATQSNPKQI